MLLRHARRADRPENRLVSFTGYGKPWITPNFEYQLGRLRVALNTQPHADVRGSMEQLIEHYHDLKAGKAVDRHEELKLRILELILEEKDMANAFLLLTAGRSARKAVQLWAELPIALSPKRLSDLFAGAHPQLLSVFVRDLLLLENSGLNVAEILYGIHAQDGLRVTLRLAEHLCLLRDGVLALDRLMTIAFGTADLANGEKPEPFYSVLQILHEREPRQFKDPQDIHFAPRSVLRERSLRLSPAHSRPAPVTPATSPEHTIRKLLDNPAIQHALTPKALEKIRRLNTQRSQRWRTEILLRELQAAVVLHSPQALDWLIENLQIYHLQWWVDIEGIHICVAGEDIFIAQARVTPRDKHSGHAREGTQDKTVSMHMQLSLDLQATPWMIENVSERHFLSVRNLLNNGQNELAAYVALHSLSAPQSWKRIVRRLEPAEAALVLSHLRPIDLEVYLAELLQHYGPDDRDVGEHLALVFSNFDALALDTFMYDLLCASGARRQMGKWLLYHGILSPDKNVSHYWTTVTDLVVAHNHAQGGKDQWYDPLKLIRTGTLSPTDTQSVYKPVHGWLSAWFTSPLDQARAALPLLESAKPAIRLSGVIQLGTQLRLLDYDERERFVLFLADLAQTEMDITVLTQVIVQLRLIQPMLFGKTQSLVEDAEATARHDRHILRLTAPGMMQALFLVTEEIVLNYRAYQSEYKTLSKARLRQKLEAYLGCLLMLKNATFTPDDFLSTTPLLAILAQDPKEYHCFLEALHRLELDSRRSARAETQKLFLELWAVAIGFTWNLDDWCDYTAILESRCLARNHVSDSLYLSDKSILSASPVFRLTRSLFLANQCANLVDRINPNNFALHFSFIQKAQPHMDQEHWPILIKKLGERVHVQFKVILLLIKLLENAQNSDTRKQITRIFLDNKDHMQLFIAHNAAIATGLRDSQDRFEWALAVGHYLLAEKPRDPWPWPPQLLSGYYRCFEGIVLCNDQHHKLQLAELCLTLFARYGMLAPALYDDYEPPRLFLDANKPGSLAGRPSVASELLPKLVDLAQAQLTDVSKIRLIQSMVPHGGSFVTQACRLAQSIEGDERLELVDHLVESNSMLLVELTQNIALQLAPEKQSALADQLAACPEKATPLREKNVYALWNLLFEKGSSETKQLVADVMARFIARKLGSANWQDWNYTLRKHYRIMELLGSQQQHDFAEALLAHAEAMPEAYVPPLLELRFIYHALDNIDHNIPENILFKARCLLRLQRVNQRMVRSTDRDLMHSDIDWTLRNTLPRQLGQNGLLLMGDLAQEYGIPLD